MSSIQGGPFRSLVTHLGILLLMTGFAGATVNAQDTLMDNPIWEVAAATKGTTYGAALASADVNGDGYGDLLVGEPAFENGEQEEGRVLLYLGSPTGLATVPAWTREGNLPSAFLGVSVSSAGDVNGDGFEDVILGASGHANPEFNEGGAWVFLGSPSGLGTAPAWAAEGDLIGAQFGYSVAGAGDVNGDGFDDIVVGAPFSSDPEMWKGKAFVFLGTPSGPSSSPAWSAEGDQVTALFGSAVDGAGDVDGDGFDDVIVGARGNFGGNNNGAIHWFRGGPAGVEAAPSWTYSVNVTNALLGSAVAGAGDVNGDGFADIMAGAPGQNAYRGRALLFLGSSSGPGPNPDWQRWGITYDQLMGSSVAFAGDVNGDGYDDFLAGSPGIDAPKENAGRAFLFLGDAIFISTDPSSSGWSGPLVETANGYYGDAVASAGDINGDGFDDVAVGAPSRISVHPPVTGRVLAFLGSANGVIPEVSCDSQPSTLNFQSQGSSFSLDILFSNLWDGGFLDPAPLSPMYLSRISSPGIGDIILPVPNAEPGCDDFTDDGIWETPPDRTLGGSGTATLRFNRPSDGHCETMDGNRQDIIAVMLDIPDGETAMVCFTGSHPDVESPFECCSAVTVTNHGNR